MGNFSHPFLFKGQFFQSGTILGKKFYTSLPDVFKEYSDNYTSLPVMIMTLKEIENYRRRSG